MINTTHDPARRSWLPSANEPGGDFPVQNLPYGTYATTPDGEAQVGVAIGDQVLDLSALAHLGWLQGEVQDTLRLAVDGGLAALMACDDARLSALRHAISDLLSTAGALAPRAREQADALLRPMASVTMRLPCPIRNYSDFLASVHHTERNGRMKGLKDPIPPAYHHVPVAYHGRPSSIVVSGTPIRRPNGQWRDAASGEVRFGPAPSMDFELELGIFIGRGNERERPIRIAQAESHIFGFCLLNDWSAKSVQWWEQVLGPFLGKSFGSSISPWIVTREALAPFRAPAPARDPAGPPLLPYLDFSGDRAHGGIALELTASLRTERMRREGLAAATISRTELANLCWTPAQMVAHHTSNGCNLLTGDLLGTGTISGADEASRACLTELTSGGTKPLQLPNGQQRGWLEDGDEVSLRAQAVKGDYVPIGFGDCSGVLAPAVSYFD